MIVMRMSCRCYITTKLVFLQLVGMGEMMLAILLLYL